MPSIDSLQTLLTNEMRDLLDAENRLTKALPKMAKAASHQDLRTALEEHLEQTEEHVHRLEQALEAIGETAKAKTCAGMKGIVEEGSEHMKEDYEDDSLKDAAVIGAAQKSEHYEIASYGTVLAHAKLLGLNEVIELLRPTLDEEKEADERLTQIAEQIVNLEAASGEGDEEEESGGRGGSSRGNGRASGASRSGSSSSRSSNGRASSGRSSGRSMSASSRGGSSRASGRR